MRIITMSIFFGHKQALQKNTTVNLAAATLSPTGSCSAQLVWQHIFFNIRKTLENYIPNTMPKTKMVIAGIKFGVALPVRCVEWTSNQIFGFAEKLIVGRKLPTNVTEVQKLNIGPKLKDVAEVKKPIMLWLIEKLQEFNK